MPENEPNIWFYAVHAFEIERTPPPEWDELYVSDPFFGQERFCDLTEVIEAENIVTRLRPLWLDHSTGLRKGIPGQELLPSIVREAGYRTRSVRRSDRRRATRTRKKKRKELLAVWKDASERAWQENLRLEKEAEERKEKEEHRRRVQFALRQCRFSRKQANMLLSMGESEAAARIRSELRTHQEELLKLRKAA